MLPAFASLGWDVALSDRGMLLLEANQGWGLVPPQLLCGPLGPGPIAATAPYWIARLKAQ